MNFRSSLVTIHGFFILFVFQFFVQNALSMQEPGPSSERSASTRKWKKSLKESAKRFITYVKDTGTIIGSCVRHPTEVAAFTASSPWVVRTVLDHVKPGNILEIGAGAGTISCPLVERFFASADERVRFDAVELRQELFETMRLRIASLAQRDGRLSGGANIHLYHDDFVTWLPRDLREDETIGFYDTVVMTVPITRLPKPVMEQILVKAHRLLKPGGVLIYVSLAGARSLGHWVGFMKTVFCCPASWRAYKAKLKFIDTWLAENFVQQEVLVWRNITPMRVYWAVKKGVAAPFCTST